MRVSVRRQSSHRSIANAPTTTTAGGCRAPGQGDETVERPICAARLARREHRSGRWSRRDRAQSSSSETARGRLYGGLFAPTLARATSVPAVREGEASR